jgi:hypothetical protein
MIKLALDTIDLVILRAGRWGDVEQTCRPAILMATRAVTRWPSALTVCCNEQINVTDNRRAFARTQRCYLKVRPRLKSP